MEEMCQDLQERRKKDTHTKIHKIKRSLMTVHPLSVSRGNLSFSLHLPYTSCLSSPVRSPVFFPSPLSPGCGIQTAGGWKGGSRMRGGEEELSYLTCLMRVHPEVTCFSGAPMPLPGETAGGWGGGVVWCGRVWGATQTGASGLTPATTWHPSGLCQQPPWSSPAGRSFCFPAPSLWFHIFICCRGEWIKGDGGLRRCCLKMRGVAQDKQVTGDEEGRVYWAREKRRERWSEVS